VLQRGGAEQFIWELATEIVVASLENSEHGAITKPLGNCATEPVVAEFKHSKGWRYATEMGWHLPSKAVVAGIEYDQIHHPFPCCGCKLPGKKIA